MRSNREASLRDDTGAKDAEIRYGMERQEVNTSAVDARIETKYQWNREKPSILVFDVNETLIDFESLNPLFAKLFGDKRVLREWLGHLIMYSMTITLSGLYKDYFSLGQGLLQMVGAPYMAFRSSHPTSKKSRKE